MKNDIENKLASLRKDYKTKLPNKINDTYKMWQEILASPSTEKISLFHANVHKFHGSADTYGYTEIGKILGRLEILSGAIEENPNQIAENIPHIETLLNQLKASIAEEQPQPALTSEANLTSKQVLTIYILDDDANYENNLAMQMSKFGYKVSKFNNVEALISAYKTAPASILVINIMQVDDELKALLSQHARAQSGRSSVIFTSKSGEFALRLKAVRMAGGAFFVKPFQPDDVINQIDRMSKVNTERYRILIVDDEIEVADYNAAILQQANMETFIITKSSEIDRALHEFKPDLILIDINMPECDGLELAAIIRQQSVFESTPIIYLSAEVDPQKQLNAMKLGADDFISKSTSATVLVTTVKNRIERYNKLNSLLVKDNLTGLYNHSFILKQLEIEVKESMLLHNPLSIVLIDLDKFKSINESYGYQAGDHVLKSLGLMLRKRLRLNDIVGRYSGAKFLIILPNTSAEIAKNIIEELRKHFLTLNYSWNQQIFNASFSACIAAFPEFQSVNDLLEAVNESMNITKKTGVNRVEVAT